MKNALKVIKFSANIRNYNDIMTVVTREEYACRCEQDELSRETLQKGQARSVAGESTEEGLGCALCGLPTEQ